MVPFPGVQIVQAYTHFALRAELNPSFTTSTASKEAQARPFDVVWRCFTNTTPVFHSTAAKCRELKNGSDIL